MNSDISPPPPKKRRIQSVPASAPVPAVPPSPPAANHLRIYSWNINGIAPFIQPSIGAYLRKSTPTSHTLGKVVNEPPITTSLRNFLRRHHWPQILHLQEVKINPSDTATQRAVETAVNKCRSGSDDGPHYSVRFCLPRDNFNARGFGRKVYGVASIIRNDFLEEEVANVREVDWDSEGRVLVIETHSKLSLWNVYAVNGTTNPYKNPATGEIAGTRHDRKLAFHDAMLQECRRLELEGFQLILAGDFNVASAEIDGHPRLRTRPDAHVQNRSDFNAKFLERGKKDGIGLVDSFRFLHPKRKKYTWMARNGDWKESCDRVDYVLISRKLLEQQPSAYDEHKESMPQATTHDAVSRDASNGIQDLASNVSAGKKLVVADILMTPADRGTSDHFPLWVELNLGK